MKKILLSGVGLAIVGYIAFAQYSNREPPVVNVAQHDPLMDAAFRKAGETLDTFLRELRHPAPGDRAFALKVGFASDPSQPGYKLMLPGTGDGLIVEYFWLSQIKETASGYEGVIDDDPEDVKALRAGTRVAFAKPYIADWMYANRGRIIGNLTACAALPSAPEEEQKQIRALGLTCD